MRTRDEIQNLLQTALGHVPFGEAEATFEHEKLLATRFGENAITQNTTAVTERVTIDVIHDGRRGSAGTSDLGDAGLAAAALGAANIARHAPPDPEHVALPGPQTYPATPPAFFADTDAIAPEQVAADVGIVVARAREAGYAASGLFQAASRANAIANTHGLFGHHARTSVDYSTTVHGPNGSGKAEQARDSHARLDVEHLARTAVANAALAQDPQPLPPGDYSVIFEPLAVGELLAFLAFTLSARDADEGTTPFAGTLDTRLFSDKVTLSLRLDDPDLPARPFGDAGLALRPTTWFERGVVRRLFHNRYWAARQGETPDAGLWPVFMAGEDRSVDDLVRDCPRGLLVKNLWYIRFVDRRSLMLTGMTRDGVFLIEDGAIRHPVKNLRWNESPITFLQNVVGLSRPERVGGWIPAMLPAVWSEAFTFTSTTDSI